MPTYVLRFLLGSLAIAQQTVPDKPALLEGTVVQGVAKEPVRKARVILELSGGDSALVAVTLVATTDDTGHFRFAEVRAGRYTLTVTKSGFLNGTYGADKLGDEGSLLQINSGDQIEDRVLRLFPAATISGRVMDPDGDPAANDDVVLWTRAGAHDRVRESSEHRNTTNLAGEYRFAGLNPGDYYISANAENWYEVNQTPVDSSGKATRLHDLTTFYPSSVALTDAQRVGVESGDQRTGIDILIRRGSTLSVKGKIAGASGSQSKYKIYASIEQGNQSTSEAGTVLPNGDFEFKELPPGKHVLVLYNGSITVGRTEVNLTDQNVTGVTITPFKPAQISVRVVLEEEDKPLTVGSVMLIPVEAGGGSSAVFQFESRNGVYVFSDVSPDRYRLSFNNAACCFLKSIRFGERVLDSDSIDVQDGAALDLLMTFSRNVASLSGDVDVPPDQPHQSAHVVLIRDWVTGPAAARSYTPALDQFFHFAEAHMHPGKYLAFAAQDADFDL